MADGVPLPPAVNENQLMFTKSPPPGLRSTANTACVPAVAWVPAADSVVHACQPPVAAIGKLASSGPVSDPVRSSTVPLPVADATRAAAVSVPAAPRSTPSKRIQSPLARYAAFCPPPVSTVVSTWTPDCAANASAWTISGVAASAMLTAVTVTPASTAARTPAARLNLDMMLLLAGKGIDHLPR